MARKTRETERHTHTHRGREGEMEGGREMARITRETEIKRERQTDRTPPPPQKKKG